ncbi:MAG TPA: zinc ribbon domain-containing protein [Pyrinomonadaceae bacterium]|jgi:hypothetical protein
MFCPQCGQQQTSDAVRFCSRCGFQLAAVSNLLATGGAAPEQAFEAVPAPVTPRRKGARLGGKLMLSGIFLAAALGLLVEFTNGPEEPPAIGALVFLAGLFRLIYAFIFEDGPFRRQLLRQPTHVPQHQFAPPREAPALPPPQGVPARAYVPPRAETSDLAYRPSVTEGTTRFLDRERDESPR